jgi:hypothetical protein
MIPKQDPRLVKDRSTIVVLVVTPGLCRLSQSFQYVGGWVVAFRRMKDSRCIADAGSAEFDCNPGI